MSRSSHRVVGLRGSQHSRCWIHGGPYRSKSIEAIFVVASSCFTTKIGSDFHTLGDEISRGPAGVRRRELLIFSKHATSMHVPSILQPRNCLSSFALAFSFVRVSANFSLLCPGAVAVEAGHGIVEVTASGETDLLKEAHPR